MPGLDPGSTLAVESVNRVAVVSAQPERQKRKQRPHKQVISGGDKCHEASRTAYCAAVPNIQSPEASMVPLIPKARFTDLFHLMTFLYLSNIAPSSSSFFFFCLS